MRKILIVIGILLVLSVLVQPLSVLAIDDAQMSIADDAQVLNGHWYKVYSQKMEWEEAQDYCASMGGHLVTITSQHEQDFVCELVKSENIACWIGASLIREDFKWVTGEFFDYTNWDDSYTYNNSQEEPYAGIYANDTDTKYSTTGKWNDFKKGTNTIKGFVCEWEPQCAVSGGETYSTHQSTP